MTSIQNEYEKLINYGSWETNPSQLLLVKYLSQLSLDLNNSKKSFQNIFNNKKYIHPKNLYIHGDVGRGKSILMDMFFKSLIIKNCRRVHFHLFMQETHNRIKKQRQVSDRGDPIKFIANHISKETKVLCFDEFQVNDTADAMIIQRLFSALFSFGVQVISTSNYKPNELYKDGINRQLFIPFIELINENYKIFELISDKDYRLQQLISNPVYFTPITDINNKKIEKLFFQLSGTNKASSNILHTNGRNIKIKRSANGIGMSDFNDLCLKPRSAADYIIIAKNFNTFFIKDIPTLDVENKNEAIRFMHLIDIFYEYKVKIICSMENKPSLLYKNLIKFPEFKRTVSRLIEMESDKYLSTTHKVNI